MFFPFSSCPLESGIWLWWTVSTLHTLHLHYKHWESNRHEHTMLYDRRVNCVFYTIKPLNWSDRLWSSGGNSFSVLMLIATVLDWSRIGWDRCVMRVRTGWKVGWCQQDIIVLEKQSNSGQTLLQVTLLPALSTKRISTNFEGSAPLHWWSRVQRTVTIYL